MKIVPHSNCDKCQLHESCHTPWMQSSGADDPLILAVGEAPGEQEDDDGIPFVGRSGQLLRDALIGVLNIEDNDLDLKDIVRFTNVVRCRPPDNKISKRHINYCRHYLADEIGYYKPNLILLFGNTPLNAVLGETGITTWNGVIVNREDAIYVPLYHPAYVLRNDNVMSEWLEGMSNAVDAVLNDTEEEEDPLSSYTFPNTVKEVLEMCEFLKQQSGIAYDVETTSLDHTISKIVVVSFHGGGRTYAVPIEHKDAPWADYEFVEVIDALYILLNVHDGNIVGHNIKFDQQHTRARFHIEFEAGGDSMLVSHLLDSRRGIHSLKRLAGLHLGMYDYDKELNDYIKEHKEADPNRGGNYGNIPLPILLPYAAMDADATFRLHWQLYKELSDKQTDFYHEVVMPASNTLSRVEYNGISIDEFIARRYSIIYDMLQGNVYDAIMEDPAIRKTLSILQEEADQKIISDIEDKFSVADIRKQDDKISYVTIKGHGRSRKRQIIEFNPASSAHLRTLFYDVYDMPVLESTDTGLPTTKSTVLTQLAKDYPIVEKVRYYKLLGKMLGTYILPARNGAWTGGDGLVHSNYNLHGTRTGRLASTDPNLQNIPTPEKEPGTLLEILPIKNLFTTRWPGHGVLMSTDYSGMELRVYASLANCGAMLDIHRRGVDFHSVVAIMVDEGKEIDDIDDDYVAWYKANRKSERYKYKWTNWTLLYKGDAYTLYKMYDIPLEEAEEAVTKYYERFPEVPQFQDQCIQFATEHGYIESPFGRREYLPYIQDTSDRNRSRRNQAMRSAANMPIQSAASDILLCAMVVIDDQLYQNAYDTLIVNTVHDSIVQDVPINEVDSIASLNIAVMENIAVYAEEYMPNLDFSWLKCPLKADVEVGTHYGAEVPYEQWRRERERNRVLQ